MHRYRLRYSVAVSTCATGPLLLVLTCLFLSGFAALPWIAGGVGCLAALAGFVRDVHRVRRRTLAVKPDGLEVQRDKYRLLVPWTGITGVQARRHQVLLAVEELVVTGAEIVPLDHRGRATKIPEKLAAGHPAAASVMVSLYDKDWRHGPIGERLRASGLFRTA